MTVKIQLKGGLSSESAMRLLLKQWSKLDLHQQWRVDTIPTHHDQTTWISDNNTYRVEWTSTTAA